MKKASRVAAALAFVLVVTSSTVVAANTDISGAWLVTIELPNNRATIEANIKQDDDKLVAGVLSPVGNLAFTGTLVDNKISAVYVLKVQGNALEVKMNGVVEGDTLSGTIEFAKGQEVKWTAVRKPVVAAETAAEPPVETPAQDGAVEAVPEAPK
jgi:hypothetical protein